MKTSFCFLCAVLLAGCATPYSSQGLFGGFSDTRLAPDLFRVTFCGNGYTSSERVQDFALLRACELTLSNRFTCFALLDSRAGCTSSSYTTPATAETITSGGGTTYGTLNQGQYYGHTYLNTTSYTTYTPGQTHTFYHPNAGLLFQTFRDKPETLFTFDAAFLRDQLSTKYHIKTHAR